MPNRSDAAPSKGTRKERRERTASGEGVTAEQVSEYLRRNPEFFVDHPGVLDTLQAPRRRYGEPVLDLQHFMVERLRHELSMLSEAHRELLVTGRSNLASQARIHRAVIACLEAPSFEQFVETVTTDVPVILDTDVATVGVERADCPAAPVSGVYHLSPGGLDGILGPGARIRLQDETRGDPKIFGPAAPLVRSEALMRLSISPTAPAALLAIGSRDPNHFKPGQGTDLLIFLSRVIECCFRGWLELPH